MALEKDKNVVINIFKAWDNLLDQRITIVTLGGTALTLLKIKESTIDIDINIPHLKDYKILVELFRKLGYKQQDETRWITTEGIPIDIYKEDYIFNVRLLGKLGEKSQDFMDFENINLRTLNLFEICITKLDRGDKRDYDDIGMVLKKEKININAIIKRYITTFKDSEAENPYVKLMKFIEEFKLRNYDIDTEIIQEVKQWM